MDVVDVIEREQRAGAVAIPGVPALLAATDRALPENGLG